MGRVSRVQFFAPNNQITYFVFLFDLVGQVTYQLCFLWGKQWVKVRTLLCRISSFMFARRRND